MTTEKCSSCGSDQIFQVDNHLTCISCGNQCQYSPVFTWSYSNPRSGFKSKAYYSRAKRFRNWFWSLGFPELKHQTEPILQLYQLIEFHWACRQSSRRYFFSRKVILYYICRFLELEIVEQLPMLKDEQRTLAQFESLQKIRESVSTGTMGSW